MDKVLQVVASLPSFKHPTFTIQNILLIYTSGGWDKSPMMGISIHAVGLGDKAVNTDVKSRVQLRPTPFKVEN